MKWHSIQAAFRPVVQASCKSFGQIFGNSAPNHYCIVWYIYQSKLRHVRPPRSQKLRGNQDVQQPALREAINLTHDTCCLQPVTARLPQTSFLKVFKTKCNIFMASEADEGVSAEATLPAATCACKSRFLSYQSFSTTLK